MTASHDTRCLNLSGVVQPIAKSVFDFFSQARTYIHLFEECTQNWFAVASIIEHTLTTLNAANPNIQEAFLRSDNAGCYHCAYLILSLPRIGEIKGYAFINPQARKDVCDRRTAALKAHMRRYINEGKIFYCLSLSASATKKNIGRLQKVQTFAARVATGARKFDHTTPTLKQLQ